MTQKIFIPTLNEPQSDILIDDQDKAEYIVAFSLINPGFTSEDFEHRMLSISSFLAEYPVNEAIEKYEEALQKNLSIHCPDSNFLVVVRDTGVDETKITLEIIVTNQSGDHILKYEKMITRLLKENDAL